MWIQAKKTLPPPRWAFYKRIFDIDYHLSLKATSGEMLGRPVQYNHNPGTRWSMTTRKLWNNELGVAQFISRALKSSITFFFPLQEIMIYLTSCQRSRTDCWVLVHMFFCSLNFWALALVISWKKKTGQEVILELLRRSSSAFQQLVKNRFWNCFRCRRNTLSIQFIRTSICTSLAFVSPGNLKVLKTVFSHC